MPRALPLAVLSLSLPLKVLAPAHAAAGPVTPMNAPGSVGLAGMKAALNIIESGDAAALTQLMD